MTRRPSKVGLLRPLIHRGGVRVDILTGVEITTGSPITTRAVPHRTSVGLRSGDDQKPEGGAVPAGTAFALVDAFTTERAFSGNPAGVLLLNGHPTDAWMQGVANELQQAETAFLAPGEDGAFWLRWFTPVAEVTLCGHATLASAHWLWELGVLSTEATAAFDTRSGRLTAARNEDRIVLDFPAVPATQVGREQDRRAGLRRAARRRRLRDGGAARIPRPRDDRHPRTTSDRSGPNPMTEPEPRCHLEAAPSPRASASRAPSATCKPCPSA